MCVCSMWCFVFLPGRLHSEQTVKALPGAGGEYRSGARLPAGSSDVQQSEMDNYQHIAWQSFIRDCGYHWSTEKCPFAYVDVQYVWGVVWGFTLVFNTGHIDAPHWNWMTLRQISYWLFIFHFDQTDRVVLEYIWTEILSCAV